MGMVYLSPKRQNFFLWLPTWQVCDSERGMSHTNVQI